MREETGLRSYILSRFFIVLIFVGITQAMSNAFFIKVLSPIIENAFQLQGLLTGANIRQSFALLFNSMAAYSVMLLTGGNAYGLVEVIVKRIFSKDIVEFVSANFSIMQQRNTPLFLIAAMLCVIAMILLWILPYVIGGIYFSISVSKRVKKMEMKRIEHEHELEKQRNLLLSDIAHDLKTPITTIAGFSKALAEGEVEADKQQEYLNSIYSKSMQTSGLVTLLFEYVKLDSAGYALTKTSEDAFELIREVVAGIYADFEDHDMTLEIEIPEDALKMQLDRVQFQRALQNLLVNAYKHNPEKTTVYVQAKRTSKNLIIMVSDNGSRIDKDVAMHLFDPFVQGDKSRTTGKGTGLGLSICRKIIEMHDGRIRLIQYNKDPNYVKSFEIKLPIE